MSAASELPKQKQVAVPDAPPLDEAVWQAWIAKGRAKDKRAKAMRVKMLLVLSIAVLLAAGIWLLARSRAT